MALENLVGRWGLVASASTTSEIAFIGEEPDPNGVSDWLNGTALKLAESLNPTTGLELKIEADGHFSERLTGEPSVEWFDADGVLLAEVEPFDGMLIFNEQCTYLRPDDIPSWGIPIEGQYGSAVLRLDDGDTKICDRIQIDHHRLVRTINVVTDELYLNRTVVVYKRISE